MEEKMLDILNTLSSRCGLIAVKAEFEAEGMRKSELIEFKHLADSANVPLYIKIGGCEAVRDLYDCKLFGAKGIIAPMIESPFAVKKFKEAASRIFGNESEIDWTLNVETITAQAQFDAILDEAYGFAKTVCFGRVDYVASTGRTRISVDSDDVLATALNIAMRTKSAGLIANFGGGMTLSSIPFIINMNSFASRFETRKAIFKITDDSKILEQAIVLSMEFELLWIKSKRKYYESIAKEDDSRIEMLTERYNQAVNDIKTN